MTNEEFEAHLEHRLSHIKAVLSKKAGEYAADGDRLHNFRLAAQLDGTTMPKALWGMNLKHLTSVVDMVRSGETPTAEMVDEKVGDLINYLILLSAVWKEQRDTDNFMAGFQQSGTITDEEFTALQEKQLAAQPSVGSGTSFWMGPLRGRP